MASIALNSAASGLSALNTRLDVVANNLANVNTAGFKSSRVNFQDLLYMERAQPGVENAAGDERPTGLYVGLGVKVAGTQADFTEGAVITTDRELDVYISGDGFFRVQVQDDLAPGGIAYTRNGQFTVNSEGELVMANDQGRRLDVGFTIPPEATGIQIDASGQVSAIMPGEEEPQQIGEILLATFINPQGLAPLGENLYAETGASGPPIDGEPGTENFGQLLQGAYEGSNVDPTRELIDLITTQRAFEMNSQSIRAADETLRTIAQLRT